MEILGTLGYSGEHIEFTAPDTLCYASGNGLCLLDTGKGPKDIIWRSEKGISCWSSHQTTNQLVIAPKIDGANVTILSSLTSQVVVNLSNPAGGKIINFCFSGDGNFLLALSDQTDHKVIMWNVTTHQILFCVDVPLPCHTCVMHPIDNLSFLIYGTEGVYYCSILEILGSYDLKLHPISIKIDSKSNDDSEYYQGISCAIWSPPTSLLISTPDCNIYYYEPLTKYTKKLITIPTKASVSELNQPVCLLLTGVYLIVGLSKCAIHWYTVDPLDLTSELLENESHFQEVVPTEADQILTLEVESDTGGGGNLIDGGFGGLGMSESHLLTHMICDKSDYLTCLASTSDGLIYRFTAEIQQITNDDDVDDDHEHHQSQQQHKPLHITLFPLYILHSGTVLSTHTMSIPISEYSSSSTALNSKNEGAVLTFDHAESVSVFITGSYSGLVSFWRILGPSETIMNPLSSALSVASSNSSQMNSKSLVSQGGSGTTGISKSIPRIPQRLCRKYICDKVELDNDVTVVPHIITAFETLSIATYGGGRLLVIGTMTGWIEVWRVEAYIGEGNENDEQGGNDSNALDEEDVYRDIKIGIQLVYRRRFYETSITSISSSDAMSCFAVSSFNSSLIYAVNTTPKNKFQEVKVFTLGDQSNKPVSISWTGPLLWVPTHEGLFFTFLPEFSQHEDLPLLSSFEPGTITPPPEENTTLKPALTDMTPIHPKVMWEIDSKSVGNALALNGSGGGCIFTKQDVSMIGLVDNYPTIFDLEHNNLLHSETVPGEDPEVPLLQMPGILKYSIPMLSPIVSIAKAPSSSLVATGTLDGSIFIWRIKRGEITLVNRYQPHCCAVINLLFTIDSSQVISSCIDGSIYILLIDKPIQQASTVTSLLLENDLYDMKQAGAINSRKILWKEQHHIEVMNQLKESFKSKSIHFQSIVENIENRLKTLLTRNNDANELEKMAPSEFVIDLKRKNEIIELNQAKSNKVREMYQLKNTMNELIAARIRLQCWDPYEYHSITILPIQSNISQSATSSAASAETSPSSLSSYSIERYTDSTRLKLERAKRLRAIEITSQRATLQVKGGGHIDNVGSKERDGINWRSCWGKNIQGTPNVISWLFNDGTRWPCQDMVRVLLELEKNNQNKEGGENTGGPGASISPIKEIKDDKKKNPKSDKGAISSTVAGTNPLGTGPKPGLDDDDLSYTGDMITTEQEIDYKNIFNLLYAPQTVRTQIQKRNQILFLKEIIRLIKINFNKLFDKIYHEKEDVLMTIQSKNIRITEIIEELDLHDADPVITPKFLDIELSDSSIRITDEEIASKPYETNAMRIKRLEEEEKKRKELAERNNDAKERALNDMMNGTLEIKRDVLSEVSSIQKPDWMLLLTTPIQIEHLNEQQKKEYEEYLAKYTALQDEKAKYRKSLEVEMKKLKGEISDVVKGFDEKLQQIIKLKILIQKEILTNELYISRLGLSMVKREQCWKMLKDVEKEIEKNRQKRVEISNKIDKLTAATEEAKLQLTSFQDEEKLLDRSFKRDLQTLCNQTFDQDILKLFTQLYRLRKYQETGYSMNDEDSDHITNTVDGRSSRNSTKRRMSLKRSLGSSKGQSKGVAHRRSKGNSVSNKDNALGPLQTAAKEIQDAEAGTNNKQPSLFNTKNPFYTHLLAQDREKKILESQLPLLQPLSIDLDTPEGFSIDPFVWSKLQELRLQRIAKEISVKGQYKSYTELKKKLDLLTNEEEVIHNEAITYRNQRENILNRMKELMNDLEIIIAVKQGQDEVDNDVVVTDYHTSKLIPTTIIHKYNNYLNELGKEKINILSKIKQFRRKMNLIDWEVHHLQLESWHLEEYYTDSQLFRVTRDLQRIIKDDTSMIGSGNSMGLGNLGVGGGPGPGNNSSNEATLKTTTNNNNIQEKILIRKEFIKKDSENKVMKMNQLIDTLRTELLERKEENDRYTTKINLLKGEVAVREQVKRASSYSAGNGGTNTLTGGRDVGTQRTRTAGTLQATGTANLVIDAKANEKMKKIVKRRKLVDVARIQAEEIDYLKQELDKLRQKTFPSFVRATRNRLVYNPDERI